MKVAELAGRSAGRSVLGSVLESGFGLAAELVLESVLESGFGSAAGSAAGSAIGSATRCRRFEFHQSTFHEPQWGRQKIREGNMAPRFCYRCASNARVCRSSHRTYQ